MFCIYAFKISIDMFHHKFSLLNHLKSEGYLKEKFVIMTKIALEHCILYVLSIKCCIEEILL